MLPEAKNNDLLYITDGIENVYVYTYPQGQFVGELTGFIDPWGECVDSAGDVFIVSRTSQSGGSGLISEYSHGGTQPTATLDDPTFGEGCSIDPTSGNLAVAGGYQSGVYPYGDVAIYADAQGNPSDLSSSRRPGS